MKVKIHNVVLELIKGDITEEPTDAIVNAANSRLAGGGGVDGAIHRAGGPEIMAECGKIGSCPTGSAVITTGGRLKARHVIHTVGPIYRDGKHKEPELLKSAYESSLNLAHEKGLTSVSFPSISTGVYGYPIDEAANIALKSVIASLKSDKGIRLVRFVLFSEDALKAYERALKGLIP